MIFQHSSAFLADDHECSAAEQVVDPDKQNDQRMTGEMWSQKLTVTTKSSTKSDHRVPEKRWVERLEKCGRKFRGRTVW